MSSNDDTTGKHTHHKDQSKPPQPFVSQNVPDDPFILEICAGSARVTICAQQLGMPTSFGVDHKAQRNSGRVLIADLTTKHGQSLCRTWLASPNLAGLFIAPPCGTCSRARGIPVRLPSGRIVPGPQPLRTDESPNGVRHMSWINRMRVSSANKLYHFITQISLEVLRRGLILCVENPRSSLYWRTTFFKPLRKWLTFTAHQACAYGSDRPKHTVLAHNTQAFCRLNHTCPGEGPLHKHRPWGLLPGSKAFATSQETAYPFRLAYNIAFCFAQELLSKGWKAPVSEFTPPDCVSYHFLRSIAGHQPKASKLAPLVSEFESQPWMGLPVKSCHLKKPPLRSKGGKLTETKGSESTNNFFFGVYRPCDQFVNDAICAGHPVGRDAVLPGALKQAVDFVSNHAPHEVASFRHDALKYWLSRAKELQSKEVAFHETLHSSLQGILAPKRLLLWKEMMETFQYPDQEVFSEMTDGVGLVGPAPYVPFFEPNFKPARMTPAELAASAPSSRAAMLASVRSSGDPSIDREVFDKSMEELECGWLSGPVPLNELPENAIISRRFGIKQSSGEKVKIRLIDDFSLSGVNSTVQVETAPKLHTLDVVGALCLELLKSRRPEPWSGKTFDLSSAYRQLGVHPDSKWASYIALFDPSTRKPLVFAMKALPFGASRSVFGFLRVAHSLWWLGAVVLRLPWSNFFDDFVIFSRSSEIQATEIVVSQFFKLLGWATSSGDKDLPFSETFKALGVEISCSNWCDGVVRFQNTEKRIAELTKTISDILKLGRLSQPDALALRGRMQFAKSQIWGRSSKLCLNAVTKHAYDSTSSTLDPHTIMCLTTFLKSLNSSRPREVTPCWDVPLFLFTDASFCPDDENWPCGLGGVLVDSSGTQLAAMSFCLNKDDLNALGFPGKSTVIFEAELLAVVLCLKLWKKKLMNRPCVVYVDNNSARDVCISGNARTFPGSSLVQTLLETEDSVCVNAWYARVPSESNVADGPSRNSLEGILPRVVSPTLVRLMLDKMFNKIRATG